MSPLSDAIQLVRRIRRNDPSDTHSKGPLNRAVAELLGHQRLWLHAHTLVLQHPTTGEPLRLQAALGDEWAVWRSSL